MTRHCPESDATGSWPEPTTPPLVVREAEAMRLVGLKRTVFRDLVKRDVIPSFTLGRSRLYRVADLRAWVESWGEAPAARGD